MKFIDKVSRGIHAPKTHFIILVLVILGVAVRSYLITISNKFGDNYTGYNNFLIFKYSFGHFIHHMDMYTAYPRKYYDLFKYTPTFAIFMFPFYFLPNFFGLLIWDALNVVVLYWAFRLFPGLDHTRKSWLFWFVLLELAGNLMYAQSNALMAGGIILAFVMMETKKPVLAALFIVLTFYIKIFGIVACILYLLYPNRLKLIGYSILWGVLFAILPLVFVGLKSLMHQYFWWFGVLNGDFGKEINFSIMGLITLYLHINAFTIWSIIIGAVVLLIPLLHFKEYADPGFRTLLLACTLMWMLIFNHMAEPASFVIEMAGIGIWYFAFQRNTFDLVLLLIALTFISLVGLGIFPHDWRDNFFGPNKVKAMPGILIWLKASAEAIVPAWRPKFYDQKESPSPTTGNVYGY